MLRPSKAVLTAADAAVVPIPSRRQLVVLRRLHVADDLGACDVASFIISASLAIRIAEQSAYVTDHVVPRLSVRMYVLW